MGYLTSDVVAAIARRDETQQTIADQMRLVSAVGRLSRNITMTSRVVGLVNVSRPEAHFVSYGATKRTELANAAAISLEAKPLAVIIVQDKYMEQDVAGFTAQFAVELANAFAEAMDREALRNTDSVLSQGIIAAATAAGNTVTESASLYTDLNNTMGLVEAAGYDVDGIVYRRAEKAAVRGALSTTGAPIFSLSGRDGEPDTLMGVPAQVAAGKALPKTATTGEARFVVGDWSNFVWGVYEGLSVTTFDSGVVTVGATTYNLIEQNLIAVRAEMRIGMALRRSDAFAVLVEAAS